MDIQPSGRMLTPILERQDLAPGPLGTVGNKRFKQQEGGTAPIGETSVMSNLLGAANAAFSHRARTPQEVQMQHGFYKQVYDNSAQIGNLLGHLTVKADTAEVQDKVSRQLIGCCKWSKGCLASLTGGTESLAAYMGELTFEDLQALRLGAAGNAEVRAAVLGMIKDEEFRDQAQIVLKEVEDALKLRLIRDVAQQPLSAIIAMLSAKTMNIVDLEGQLCRLHRDLDRLDLRGENNTPPAVYMLDIYLKCIPVNDRASLLDRELLRRLDVVEQALLQLYDDSRRQHALDMLRAFRRSLGRCIYARVEGALTRSACALSRAFCIEGKAAISKALLDLHDLVHTTEQSYGWLPVEITENVQELAKHYVGGFRHSSNPSGALNAASLGELDDFTLGNLRHATSLHALGLELNHDEAAKISMNRVEPLSRQLAEGMEDVFRALSGEQCDELALMRQLRSLSDVEQQRTWQLAGLGQFASSSPSTGELRSMAYRTCEPIVADLNDDQKFFLASTMTPYLKRLKGLTEAFDEVVKQMAVISDLASYRDGASQIEMHLVASHRLLNGLGDMMSRLRSDLIRASLSANENALRLYEDELAQKGIGLPSMLQLIASAPSNVFYLALREQYGVAYGPGRDQAAVLVTDSVRAQMVPELEALASAAEFKTQEIMLPVDGTPTRFWVSDVFHEGIIERRSIFLSVQGTEAQGRPVRYTWPVQASLDAFPHAMGRALDALGKVAGSREKAQAHLMHYEHMLAAAMQGLGRMGRDSPFKLEDDTAVLFPTDGWTLTLDVAQTENGNFRNTMTVRFPGIHAARGLRPDNTNAPIVLNPESSWAEIQYIMHVSADASRIERVEVPLFRYHFDLLESQARQAA